MSKRRCIFKFQERGPGKTKTNIPIKFVVGDHGDEYPFDGPAPPGPSSGHFKDGKTTFKNTDVLGCW